MIIPAFRTRLEIYGLILFALVAWIGYGVIKDLRNDLRESRGNVAAAVKEPGETAAEFTLSKKDFESLFPTEAHDLDSLKRTRRTDSYHTIKWKEKIVEKLHHDTIYLKGQDSVREWRYEKNCITGKFIYPDSAGTLGIDIENRPRVDIVGELHRPKHWFWKLQWFRFNDSISVTTPCNWEVTKNVKFNFK